MSPKLPKQWKHWCQKAGLDRHTRTRGVHKGRYPGAWLYLKGRGRVWRLNDKGMFQCGDTYAEFDRWALCDIEALPRPNSLAEFLTTVEQLLQRKATAGHGPDNPVSPSYRADGTCPYCGANDWDLDCGVCVCRKCGHAD